MYERFLVQAETNDGKMIQIKYCFIENAIIARRAIARQKGIIKCALYEITSENRRETELILKRI